MTSILPGLSTRIIPPVSLVAARFGVQVFAASGTFTLPPGVTAVTAMVICIGGGGAGGGYDAGAPRVGGNGGTSSFGSLVSASGGTGGGGSNNPPSGGAPGTTNGYKSGAYGVSTTSFVPGPLGAVGFMGIASGGNGGNSNGIVGSGGSAASGAVGTYFGTVTANQAVTIGTGGAIAGSPVETNGTNGAAGAVFVFYWW